MDGDSKFHPFVLEILDSMSANGCLSGSAMLHWTDRLSKTSDSHQIAIELVALALRFRKGQATEAMLQMILLTAALLGESKTIKLMSESGFDGQSPHTLLRKASTKIAEPRGLNRPMAGVGLRSPKK
jgi:hypothetical protein